jgi:hypothetical protein
VELTVAVAATRTSIHFPLSLQVPFAPSTSWTPPTRLEFLKSLTHTFIDKPETATGVAEMAEDVPKAKPQLSAPWSDKEFAFLLNHADYCIQNDQDYSSTIVDALSSFTSAQRRSASSVYSKLRWCLSKNGEDTSASKFRQQGTAYLHLKSLPLGVLHEMASQRETLGLEALALTDPLTTAAGGDATNPSLDGPESVSLRMTNNGYQY